jgi:nucleoside-triphosphatase
MSLKNLLITGRPRVGKTTLIKRLTEHLGTSAAGFTTGEIREGGNRVGFSIESLDGQKGILAKQGLTSRYTLGRYGVDVDAMDRIGTASLQRAIADPNVRYIIVDEIGKMEEYSKAFKKAMIGALDCDKRVIATIRLHDSE